MKLKNIWITYSLIGNSLFLILFFSNCEGEIDYRTEATFLYENPTKHIINTGLFILDSGNTYSIYLEGEGSENIDNTTFVPPSGFSDIIEFDNVKCDTLYMGDNAWGDNGEGIFGIQNYDYQKLNDRHYKFIYTFTESDYLKATNCK